jgi:uncharacterized protein with HEPN domain
MSRDDAYLVDMLLFARRAQHVAEGRTHSEFLRDSLAQDAAIRCLSVIGEAAGKVSAPFCERHPEVQWALLSGMRNRLVHEYRHVDLERIWDALIRDVPALSGALEPLVPPRDHIGVPEEWEFL